MSDAQALYAQGLRKHRDKDYDGAIECLRQAVAADATHADAWEALGVVYSKVDRLDDAIQAMEKLLEIRPDEVMAHTNLSRFYMKKGMTEKAEEAQAQARVLGWKQEIASGGPAGNDLQQASSEPAPGAAPVSLSSLVSGGPTPPSVPTPAKPDAEALQRKIDQFRAVLSTNPQDTLSRFTLGKTYLQANQPQDAVDILEELLEMKPDYTAAMVVYCEALEKAGKLAKAIKSLNKGIELAETKGDLHPRNQMQEMLARLSGSPSSHS